jgi:hypothetical protein
MSTMPDVQVLITLGVDTTPMRTWRALDDLGRGGTDA